MIILMIGIVSKPARINDETLPLEVLFAIFIAASDNFFEGSLLAHFHSPCSVNAAQKNGAE